MMVVSLWLAVSFSTLLMTQSDQGVRWLQPLNLMAWVGITEHRQLKNNADRLTLLANDATWQQDRVRYSKQLIEANQTILNKQATNGRVWQKLLQLQYQQGEPYSDIMWSLDQALQWNQWHVKSRKPLSFYCFYYWYQLPDSTRLRCHALISHLAHLKDYSRRQRLLGLDQTYIQTIIETVLAKQSR